MIQTRADLDKYFKSSLMLALVYINSKKHTITFMVHAEVLGSFKDLFETQRPLGLIFSYKPLKLWHFWKLRKTMVKIYER